LTLPVVIFSLRHSRLGVNVARYIEDAELAPALGVLPTDVVNAADGWPVSE
jgi:hypothetical protein